MADFPSPSAEPLTYVISQDTLHLRVEGIQHQRLELDASRAASLVTIHIDSSVVVDFLHFQGAVCQAIRLDGITSEQLSLEQCSVEQLRLVSSTIAVVEATDVSVSRLLVTETDAGSLSLSSNSPIERIEIQSSNIERGRLRCSDVSTFSVIRSDIREIELNLNSTDFVEIQHAKMGNSTVLYSVAGTIRIADSDLGDAFHLRGRAHMVLLSRSHGDGLRVGGSADQISIESSTFERVAGRFEGQVETAEIEDCSIDELFVRFDVCLELSTLHCRFADFALMGATLGALALESTQVGNRISLHFGNSATIVSMKDSAFAAGSISGVSLAETDLIGCSGLEILRYGAACIFPHPSDATAKATSGDAKDQRDQIAGYDALARGVEASSGRWQSTPILLASKRLEQISEQSWLRRAGLALWGISSGYGTRPFRVLGFVGIVIALLAAGTSYSCGCAHSQSLLATLEALLQADAIVQGRPAGCGRWTLLAARALGPVALLAIVASARRRGYF